MYNFLYKSFKYGGDGGGKKLNSSWQQHYICRILQQNRNPSQTCGYCKVRVAHSIRIWILRQVNLEDELLSCNVVLLGTCLKQHDTKSLTSNMYFKHPLICDEYEVLAMMKQDLLTLLK